MRRRLIALALALGLLLCAATAFAEPVVRSVGSFATSASPALPVPGVPAGSQVGDLWLMGVESDGAWTPSTGWAQVDGSPNSELGGADDTFNAVVWHVVDSTDIDGTCEICTLTSASNHTNARIVSLQVGTWNTGDKWDQWAFSSSTAGGATSLVGGGDTATSDNTLVVCFVGGNDDDGSGGGITSWSHALVETEQMNNASTSGNDGLIGMVTFPLPVAGAWGNLTVNGPNTRWTMFCFNVEGVTPTHTPTHTITNTPTITPTPSATAEANGGYTCYTPAADADDGVTTANGPPGVWTPSNTPTVNTGGTAANAGKLDVGTTNFVYVALARFDTSDLGANNRSPVSATLELNLLSVVQFGSRTFQGEWVAAESGWSTADYSTALTANALDDSNTYAVRPWSFTLTNAAANVDVSSYTGIKLSASGGDPTGADQLVLNFEMRENAGTSPARLCVYWRQNTPTPSATGTVTATATATGTHTATGTQTPTHTATATASGTPTWTLEPDTRWCPDLTGDYDCGIKFVGDEQLQSILEPLAWTLSSGAGMICDQFIDGEKNAAVRQGQQAEATPGVDFAKCLPHGGSLVRGTDMPADVVVFDPFDVHAYDESRTSPRDGTCTGTSAPCRVDAIYGPWDGTPAGVARCVGGLNYGDDCTPPEPDGTPASGCGGDLIPADEVLSLCQRNAWRADDPGLSIENCGLPHMCLQRARVAASRLNIEAAVNLVLLSGRQPLLLIPPYSATWARKGMICCSDASGVDCALPVVHCADDSECAAETGFEVCAGSDCDQTASNICLLPEGTDYPQPECRAPWEATWCDGAMLRQQWKALADTFRFDGALRKLPYVDCQAAFIQGTDYAPWRGLQDTRYPSSEGLGACSCVEDADCGLGGLCDPAGFFCTAGPRASCETNVACWGGSSIQQPGEPFCILDLGAWICARAVKACLTGAYLIDPFWEAYDIVACGLDRFRRNEEFEPPPTPPPATTTATPTETRTPTITYTITSGPSPTPTATWTATPTTSILTEAPPRLSESCQGIVMWNARFSTNSRASNYLADALVRKIRNIGNWIDNNGWAACSSPYGYESGSCMEPLLGTGKVEAVSTHNHNGLPNEMICRDRPEDVDVGRCWIDMAGRTNHCEKDKVSNPTQWAPDCTLMDWDTVFKLTGSSSGGMPTPQCGVCSTDGSQRCSNTTDSCPCTPEADPLTSTGVGPPHSPDAGARTGCPGTAYPTTCPNSGTCVPLCDPHLFGNPGCDPHASNKYACPMTDFDPPGYLDPPIAGRYGFEVCRCVDEAVAIPTIEDMLETLRDAIPPAPHGALTNACASKVMNEMNDVNAAVAAGCPGYCQDDANSAGACDEDADCWSPDHLVCDVPSSASPGTVGNCRKPCDYDTDCAGIGQNNCVVATACTRDLHACYRLYPGRVNNATCGGSGCAVDTDILLDSSAPPVAATVCAPGCSVNPQLSCLDFMAMCDTFNARSKGLRYGLHGLPGGL